MTLLIVAPRVFAWAFEQTVFGADAMLMDWTKSDTISSLSMFLKLRYCSVSLRDALFTEIPLAENASDVMMAADIIGKAIRARLRARQEFIDWRAAVVAFGPGRCGQQLRVNLDFEGHQMLIPSGLYDLDGILGRTVAEVKRAVTADVTLEVVRAAKRLAVFEDFCGGPFVKYLTRADLAFIGRLSVIFRGARRGGSERARALRFREDEGHRIRNLIAAPNVRMSEEGLGGLSLVPVPNTTDSTMYAEVYNLGGLGCQYELDRRQASTLFFQDAYGYDSEQ